LRHFISFSLLHIVRPSARVLLGFMSTHLIKNAISGEFHRGPHVLILTKKRPVIRDACRR